MNIINTTDGRSFIVCETIKHTDPNSELVKNIRLNRHYDATIKHGDSVLLCNEIINAEFEMIPSIKETEPKVSNIKITTDEIKDRYTNESTVGDNVNITI